MSLKADQELQGRVLAELERHRQPISIRRLVDLLSLPRHQERRMQRLLRSLRIEGRVVAEGRGRFRLSSPNATVEGILNASLGSRAFVSTPAGEKIDVEPRRFGGALPGDRVVCQILLRRARGAEGEIVSIVKRGGRPIIGLFRRGPRCSFVAPDDPRLPGPIRIDHAPADIEDGLLVAVAVDDPKPQARLAGRIVEVVGPPGELATERERLRLLHGLERRFADAVLEELNQELTDPYARRRVDLRHLPLITIDPDDAKDFDDAVFVEEQPSGFRLIVAIADVGAFVHRGTALDEEAVRRGCSVYLPGTVYPMLPPKLSEELCSLRPGVDRAGLAVELEIDRSGLRLGGRAFRCLLRSAARLTYREVEDTIAHGSDRLRPQGVDAMLRSLGECARALLRQMRERGQLSFDLPESEIQLDSEGFPARVRPAEALFSHHVIEACMVAANEAVAELLTKLGAPLLYRVHPAPDAVRIAEFEALAERLGLRLKLGPTPSPLELQRCLEALHGQPLAPALEPLLLRSLQQARYSAQNLEHYGLASPCYLHFTSPIRRYPDLFVHRQLHALLDRAKVEGVSLDATDISPRWPHDPADAVRLADMSSAAEREAMTVERESTALYHAAYLSRHLGEEARGRATYVADFGLFVRLLETGIEGLIHISRLPGDQYSFDPERLEIVGRRTNRRFHIGQELTVLVAAVSLGERKIDFDLVE